MNTNDLPLSPEALNEQALALANEVIDKVLKHEQPRRIAVVLEAMSLLYEFHAKSLPPVGIGMCALHLSTLAKELTQAAGPVCESTTTH